MNKTKSILLMLGILLGVYLGLVVPQWMREYRLKQRLEDVANLRNAYIELDQNGSNIITMSNLLETLDGKGIHLHNPIPVQLNRPCYLLISREANSDLLIVETNTTDPANVVVGLRGGSVGVLNSNQVRRHQ
jgi:hypothetical protein